MEVGETNSQDGLNEVSLQHEATTCTIDAKALEENGGDLGFESTFSPETQVASLAEMGEKVFWSETTPPPII